MTLAAQTLIQFVVTETSTDDLASTVRTTNITQPLVWADGTGSGEAQLTWSDTRTFGPSDEDTLDFRALPDARGTVLFTEIKAIYVKAGAGYVYFGSSSGENPLNNSPTAVLSPGSVLSAVFPSAGITTSTTSKFVIINGGESETYDILVIGEGSIS